jgi:phage shock protein E
MTPLLTRDKVRQLLDRDGVVVDVRSIAEYEMGHVPDSIHLPVHLVPHLAAERLPTDRPLLICCASGARSHMAAQQLRSMGFEAHNLGPWTLHPDLS